MKKSKVKAETKASVPKPAPVEWEVTKERIRLLIEALRSGKIPQIRMQLRSNEGMCADGVACEVFRKATGQGVWSRNTLGTIDFIVGEQGMPNGYIAPSSVWQWYGDYQLDNILMSLNDDLRYSFDQIADELEHRYMKEDV